MTKVNPGSKDEELDDALKSMDGRVDPDEGTTTMRINGEDVPVTTETKVEEGDEDEEPDEKAEDGEGEGDDKKKREVIKPEEEKPEDGDDSDEDDNGEPLPKDKPHIPVKKYTDEKRAWKEEKAKLEKQALELQQQLEEKDTKIAEFTALTEKKPEVEGTKAYDAEVKKFADKYSMDEEDVKGLLDAISKNQKPQTEVLDANTKKLLEDLQLNQIKTAFDDEFKAEAIPVINEMYPDATPEQIEKIKAALDKESHLPANANKELGYLLFINKKSYAEFVKKDDKDGKVEKVTKKGMETSRRIVGDKPGEGLTAKDFVGGKTDFSVLNDLDPTQANKIVSGFDVDTYEAWKSHVSSTQEGVTVNRNGKKIILK